MSCFDVALMCTLLASVVAQDRHSVRLMQVRRLQAKDVSLIATIDRSEHVDVQYRVIDGVLQPIPAAITEVAGWDPTGSGAHSVTAGIAFCESVVARGGIPLGAFDGERTVGLAIVHPAFEPLLAWLAFLHVSRPYRRRVRRRLSGTLPPTLPWRTVQSRSTSLRHGQNPRLASISDRLAAWRIRFTRICSPRSRKTFISFAH